MKFSPRTAFTPNLIWPHSHHFVAPFPREYQRGREKVGETRGDRRRSSFLSLDFIPREMIIRKKDVSPQMPLIVCLGYFELILVIYYVKCDRFERYNCTMHRRKLAQDKRDIRACANFFRSSAGSSLYRTEFLSPSRRPRNYSSGLRDLYVGKYGIN